MQWDRATERRELHASRIAHRSTKPSGPPPTRGTLDAEAAAPLVSRWRMRDIVLHGSTHSPAFERWANSRAPEELWDSCHRLDWMLWLRALLLPDAAQLELLEDLGALLMGALEVSGARTSQSDRALELLALGRSAEAAARARGLRGDAFALLGPLAESLGSVASEPSSMEELLFAEAETPPPWPRAVREACRMLGDSWELAHRDALERVRARGCPARSRAARFVESPGESVGSQAEDALRAGLDRRDLVARLVEWTRRLRWAGRTEVESVLDAAARWAEREGDAWGVVSAAEALELPGTAFAVHGWRDGTAVHVTRLATEACFEWESEQILVEWLRLLARLSGASPPQSAGWMRRAWASWRARRFAGRADEVLSATRRSPRAFEHPTPLLAWVAEISGRARAWFEPDRAALRDAWRDCPRPEWQQLVVSIVDLPAQRWLDALMEVAGWVASEGSLPPLRARDHVGWNELAVELGERAMALAPDPSMAARAEVLGETLYVFFEDRATADHGSFARTVAQHLVAREIAKLRISRPEDVESHGRLDVLGRAHTAWALAGGSPHEPRELSHRLEETLPWSEIERLGHGLPHPDDVLALQFASRMESLCELPWLG